MSDSKGKKVANGCGNCFALSFGCVFVLAGLFFVLSFIVGLLLF